MSSITNLDFFARRLSQRAALDEEDRAAVSALPFQHRYLNPSAYVVREGEPPRPHCSFVLSGLAFRHKLTVHGARQIVSIHLAGDLLDLQHLFLNIADHSVQALTELEVADIDRDALREIALERPAVGQALWIDGLVDASIYREWVLNVGRRDARARIAHILCEIAVRMHAAGVIDAADFHLPMTQEQLGDATGMTSVHVNRTLKALAKDGLIDHSGRWIAIQDWNKIRREGDFNPLYLHLDQVAPHLPGPLSSMFP
ncbi:hypothetical protein sphantq_01680 [Sphingobium sp. AntQ-1]|uniref:Crp/Fnr family transcriptional regulator n=1 Tax=unclassified Sphingobium TaxID=2611147 RepID=UPI000C36BEC0|nr:MULTISPECIES: Crp/Fnr family transcriptional regulator [unclassified Sphingobium]MBS89913.1 Crp/Fnr family transcriptional regulator [Sphingobium sp.]WCP13261.1 hypothetical protein sphantq_01680 [Sphingobium sp. AntQ-1]